jgi:hypothetical protein
MKTKIITTFLILFGMLVAGNSVFATTITAVATGNWSATATWDGATVPSATDSVVVPSAYTVTIDAANYTCHGIYVSGTVSMTNTFYVGNINIAPTGKFYASTNNTSSKLLYWGVTNTGTLATPTANHLTGDMKITVDGQFGGSVAGTNDGIAINYGELATSLTIDGASIATNYISRFIPYGNVDQPTSTDFNLNIKQNLYITNSGYALSLQNNKKFVGSRTMTIFPGYTVTLTTGRLHTNSATTPTADEGNVIYNIYGNLDLATGSATYFDLYTTSFAGSTQTITVNVGNGTDYGVLKLGRNNNLKKYYSGQAITLNWNNPKSRIVLGGNGAIGITSQTWNTAIATPAYVDDISNLPSSIRNLSYANASTSAGFVMNKKITVTDTLYMYGYGNKFYVGAVIDGTAKYATVGRLFSYGNNAYVVTSATAIPSQVSSTTLGSIGSWVKGTTVQDAAGNSYYCDSVGLFVGTVIFPSATSTTAEELTGAPVKITGNVVNNFAATYTGRFSSATYIGGNMMIGSGIHYFAATSSVGGTFTNVGTVSFGGDIAIGDLVNNGTFTLGAKMLTLTGNISGTNAVNASTGIIQYAGTTDRTISGVSSNTFSGLRLNTTGTISLGGATTVTGGLTLTNGKLAIGNNDLIPTSLSGGSSSAYVITNGTGVLALTTTDATSKLFPVGTSASSYDPVSITPTTGSVTAVRVSGTLSGATDAHTSYNQKEWTITPTVASSSVVTLTPSSALSTAISDVIGQNIGGTYQNTVVTKSGNNYSATFTSFEPFVTGTNDLGTGISNLKNQTNIAVANHQLIVRGVEAGKSIAVYTVDGQLLKCIAAQSEKTAINMKSGMYLIKVNNKAVKVVL